MAESGSKMALSGARGKFEKICSSPRKTQVASPGQIAARCSDPVRGVLIVRRPARTVEIDQPREPGYDCVSIGQVGFADPYAIEGVVVLRSDSGREYPMSSFSGEVARHIAEFMDKKPSAPPSVYGMIEELCGNNGQFLAKVKLYESGEAVRANLYFAGRDSFVLRNYRASDAIALAIYYRAPILIREELLRGGLEP